MIECKNTCASHLHASKTQTYNRGGCYCKICDCYFKERFVRCPCCNGITRNKPRSNRRLENDLPRVV